MTTLQNNPLTWAIRRGFEHYVDFSGRASRQEFGFWHLGLVLANIFIILTEGFWEGFTAIDGVGADMALVLAVTTFLPTAAVSWRRVQDFNLEGQFSLILWALVFLIGFFIGRSIYVEHDYNNPDLYGLAIIVYLFLYIFLFVNPGSKGSNKFGQKPNSWKNDTRQSVKFISELISDTSTSIVTQKSKQPYENNANEADDHFYELAGRELQGGQLDPGVWARALSEAGPEENRVKQRYIQLRVERLRQNRDQ